MSSDITFNYPSAQKVVYHPPTQNSVPLLFTNFHYWQHYDCFFLQVVFIDELLSFFVELIRVNSSVSIILSLLNDGKTNHYALIQVDSRAFRLKFIMISTEHLEYATMHDSKTIKNHYFKSMMMTS